MTKRIQCGGALMVEQIAGCAVYRELKVARVYKHKCARCWMTSERPSIGGTCLRMVKAATP
jgi:hypothetical protein